MPKDASLGIGVVGAGTIIRVAHLPAYRKAGFAVRGIYDPDLARAEEVARDFSLPRVYDQLDRLLDDPDVAIVDIGVPPDQQILVAKEAAAAGKHLLCQKPLAWSLREAAEIVDAAAASNVKLAVNQQTRWAPAVQAAKKALDAGLIGSPTRCAFDFAFLEDSPWWNAASEPTLRADCIHTVDVLRFLLGEPLSVVARMWRDSGQRAESQTLVEILLDYGATMVARVSSNAFYWLPEARADFELQGTEGIIRASLAEWTHYPLEVPDRFELVLRQDTGTRYVPRFTISHIPDAFIATMADLMIAIERDREPSISGRDNLRTLTILEAASLSASTGQSVRPEMVRVG
jgi:predicted dehydrogenase